MMQFLALSLSNVVFTMLINVEMPSRINFVLSWVEHDFFITSGPDILSPIDVCLLPNSDEFVYLYTLQTAWTQITSGPIWIPIVLHVDGIPETFF